MKNTPVKRRILKLAVLAGTIGLMSAGRAFIGSPAVIPDLGKKLEDYYRRYPQQKVYLHLDKLAYRAGDRIWYRAYLVDARTLKPDTISKNLLVEILTSYGRVSMAQLLKMEAGQASGDFQIPDTMREGLYQIRAYTNWMRNFGTEYYFTRNFNIWNPGQNETLYRDDKLASKRHKRISNRKSRKIDVQFFPEGGYLVAGIPSKVGFKAVNELGLGIPVSGKLMDRKKTTVAEFESFHLGMGAFSFTPSAGGKYTAEVTVEGGRIYRYTFPGVESSGYSMKLTGNDKNSLRLSLSSTFDHPEVLLACHMRGKLLYASEIRLGAGSTELEIPAADFPGGILQITLFDGNRKPRCERLAYLEREDGINLSIRQDKNEYKKLEEVSITLVARDAQGRPVEGEFSVSVSDRDLPNNASDFQSGIRSTLLLSSDLRGRIEQPDYYFQSRDASTREALDNLMLTQGWRRFSWEDILEGNSREIDYPIQKGLIVRGKVTKEFLEIPLKHLPVTLTVLSEFNDVYITHSDNRGEFEFVLPDYEDTLQVELTARRTSGRKNLVIYLEDSELEGSEKIYSAYSSEMAIQGSNALRPVPEPVADSMSPKLEGIYRTPDFVLHVDDAMRSYNSVLEMIQGRIPGVVVSGNTVQIRGPSSFYGSNEPLFLIDNVPTDLGAVQSLSPNDIDRIEVLKGPSSAIYGVRGANGVIAIFTKRGRFMIKGILTFEMLGYHRPHEFYSPRYGTDFDYLVEDNRTCLYWEPEVKTDGNGIARIKFFNSGRATRYYIVAEGVSPQGKIGQAEKSYTVQ